MSFLLDALRKSDARRRMGETPGLNSSPPPESGGTGKKTRRLGALLLAVVLVVILAVALVFIQPAPISDRIQQWVGSTPETEVVDPSSDTPAPGGQPEEPHYERSVAGEDIARRAPDEASIEQGLARERIVSDPAEIDAELSRLVAEQAEQDEIVEESSSEPAPARRDRRETPSPRTSVVAESPARDQRLAVDPRDTERMERLIRAREARLAEAEAGSRARSVGREPEARPDTTEPADESWSPEAAEYVRVWELPLSVRRNLPELRLSIHVFAVEQDQRFVLVNGERFVTGDMISSNVRLVEIRREGAVVDFRDYRFLLEP